MKICLVAPSSLRESYPYDFFVGALSGMGIASEIVNCDDQPTIDLALKLAARQQAGLIDRAVYWACEEIALGMRGVAGLGRAAIVPRIGYRETKAAAWWHQFQTDQFVALSRSLHEQLLTAGVASAHFQYYQPAVPLARLPDSSSARSAVLWERAGSTAASIQLAAIQCRAMGLHRLLVANLAGDDLGAFPGWLPAELAGFVEFADPSGSYKPNLLQGLLAQHSCFIIPDASAGLCPLTLSAIAAGRIIVAPDCGWIRDYVGHLATGVLYDPAAPLALPWLDGRQLRELATASLARSERNYSRWQLDQDRLRSIIADDQRRWSSTDRSAEFGNLIRRRANEAAQRAASPQQSPGTNRKMRSSRPFQA